METLDVDKLRKTIPSETVECFGCHDTINLLEIRKAQARAKIHKATQRHAFIADGECPDSREPDMPMSYPLYDTPWQDEPDSRYFCSEDCREAGMHIGDFSYLYCEGCDRNICEQNPSNGYHTQFRFMDDGMGIPLCLRCYQEHVLSGGLTKDDFRDSIPGMFFNRGNPEPKKRGYREVPGWKNVKVTASGPFNSVARELIGRGYDVVPGYERLSIMGGEGYVTMLARRPEETDLTPVESLDLQGG